MAARTASVVGVAGAAVQTALAGGAPAPDLASDVAPLPTDRCRVIVDAHHHLARGPVQDRGLD